MQGEWGDLWTWTAIDSDTKLIISYLVGARVTPNAYNLMWDLAERVITVRPQVTTDGLKWYEGAIMEALPWADYGVLAKTYAAEPTGRYSPPRFVSARREIIKGDPDPRHISTSHVEQPHDADVYTSVYTTDERVQQDGARSRRVGGSPLRVLQFRAVVQQGSCGRLLLRCCADAP